jgi:hypothetical protein
MSEQGDGGDDDEKGDIAIAMVATSSTRLPPAEKIVAAAGGPSKKSRSLLGRLFGAKPAATPAAAQEQQWQENNLVFHFRDGMIAVALMPAPIPWSDLEGPCATSWWWEEATEKMRGHKYHFIVTVMGGTIPPVERRIILTNLVATVLRHTDAVGVYWAEGTVVAAPEAFLEQSEGISETQIPGQLWIDRAPRSSRRRSSNSSATPPATWSTRTRPSPTAKRWAARRRRSSRCGTRSRCSTGGR